ncbi:MAG: DUF58 domain-containing protein [Planctomycetota bacterium]|nr:MAG: DUF58 domain-containing protein [Planctomycetota bacterium]
MRVPRPAIDVRGHGDLRSITSAAASADIEGRDDARSSRPFGSLAIPPPCRAMPRPPVRTSAAVVRRRKGCSHMIRRLWRRLARGFPLAGVLGLAAALALLISVYKFPWLRTLPSNIRMALAVVALTTAIASGLSILRVLLWPQGGTWYALPYRVLLPREGMVYLAIMVVLFIGSLLGRSNTLMLVFAMMAGPFVLNGWITFTMLKRLQVRRELPPRAMAGSEFSVAVTLQNRRLLFGSWLMAVTDKATHAEELLSPRVMFIRVPPRSSRTAYYRLRLQRRGRYRLGPVEVGSRFPLGLVERSVVLSVPGEVLVHPRLGRLTPRWYRVPLLATELLERQRTRRGTFDDDFHHLREYRPGDNPRSIHWRTSARRNELMVREYHQSRDRDLLLALDLYIPPRRTAGDTERVELALEFAATVAIDYLRRSFDGILTLAVSGPETDVWECENAPPAIDALLDRFALLEASSHSSPTSLLQAVRDRLTAHQRRVLITTRLEVPTAPFTDDALLAGFEILRALPEELAPLFVPLRDEPA